MNTRTVLSLAACCLMLSAPHALAQNPIPNPGFENWASGNPVGWYTSNDGLPGSVTQTADKHAGSWAVRGDVVEIFPGFNGQPTIMTGEMSEGFPTNKQWASFDGFYKFNSVGGDVILFSVNLTSPDSNTIGGGSMFLAPTGGTFQPFSVPINWIGPSNPDTCLSFAFIYGPMGTPPHLGSYFIFDDFAMTESAPPVCPVTMTGDVDQSGTRATSDIIYMVNHVLKAGPVPLPCRGAGDVDCNGALSLSDIVYLVNAVLKGGPAPCDVCTIVPGSWACP